MLLSRFVVSATKHGVVKLRRKRNNKTISKMVQRMIRIWPLLDLVTMTLKMVWSMNKKKIISSLLHIAD